MVSPKPEITSSIIEKVRKCLNLAANAKTEAEAVAAQKRAAEIITKYGIEHHMLGVRQEQGDGCSAHEIAGEANSSAPWFRPIVVILFECFGARVMTTRKKWFRMATISLICRHEDRDLALFAWSELPRLFLSRLDSFRADTLAKQRERLKAVAGPNYPAELIERYMETNVVPKVKTAHFSKSYFHGLGEGFRAAWKDEQARVLAEASKSTNPDEVHGAESYALALTNRESVLKSAMERIFPDCSHERQRTISIDGYAHREGVKHGREIKLLKPIEG